MDERDQQRKISHRVASLRHAAEVTGNVAHTCRYYGITRPTFYRWLNRYAAMLLTGWWRDLDATPGQVEAPATHRSGASTPRHIRTAPFPPR